MISVIVPSRNRPNELRAALESLQLAKHGLEALVWLDEDDLQLDKYKEFFEKDPNVKLFIKERVGYKDLHIMLNFLCSQIKYDWILEFNDDAYMGNPEWFEKFSDFVRQFEPTNQPVAIKIWGQENTHNLFPIVSRKFVDILGHFSLFFACDTWVEAVSLGANVQYNLNGIKLVHRKYGDGEQLLDQTFTETQRDIKEVKHSQNPKRSPWRQLIREDAGKIISYNMSTQPAQLCQMIKTIGFIGLGKLGLPIAEAIAKKGFKVIGYDIKNTNTTLPLAKSIKKLVKKSDLIFCAVQTPHDPQFEGDKVLPKEREDFNYSYLIKAVKEVVAADKEITLVVISTCLPGTFEKKIKPLLSDKINYLYNPFFVAMGTVVEDFLNPEFALIGGDDPAILKHFYTKMYGQDRSFVTDITTAEGIKVFYNTFVTTKTVLGNMYGEFAHKTGMNADHIYEALSKATVRLISPKYLKSGMADGGSCHPRDNIALSHLAKKVGLSFNYFDSIMMAREKHTEWLADLFIEQIRSTGLGGIILGKSFKPETDIQTGSAAILLANILKGKTIDFKHYEFDYPEQLPVGVYFIATQHPVYQTLTYSIGSVIIDPFRYINSQSGVKIIGIGRAHRSLPLIT